MGKGTACRCLDIFGALFVLDEVIFLGQAFTLTVFFAILNIDTSVAESFRRIAREEQ